MKIVYGKNIMQRSRIVLSNIFNRCLNQTLKRNQEATKAFSGLHVVGPDAMRNSNGKPGAFLNF